MKLVVIFGPHAVGKMTVGQELAKLTGLKLFHNHMTIDIVSNLFENMPKERIRLTNLFRKEIFEAYSKSDEYGMIFTYMWALDSKEDWDYINDVEKLFISRGAEVYYVELVADFDLRIDRNKTENRLFNKPSKRNTEHLEYIFRKLESKYRLNSLEGEISKENYMKINNSNLSPDIVAQMIKNKFAL
ncbi:AAA family ATPase [Desnuesiella massiliensis]|uniref:AAA family ATPase n=1 Tax=Desnuesiella massiliensis TaxID=1650662 RepID=UPI0006E1A307|nr:AAA family ATPase [Desnuesiella massiliensis]